MPKEMLAIVVQSVWDGSINFLVANGIIAFLHHMKTSFS
jgi:hypothetical protein